MNIVNSFHIDHHTESSGTVITELIPPLIKSASDTSINNTVRTRLTSLVYTAAGTVHDLVIMRALAQVVTTTADVATATVIDVSSASFVGDTLASGDYIVIQHSDGTFGMHAVSSLSTLAVTISTGLAKASNAGAKVWIMGSPTAQAAYHQTLKSIASTRIEFIDPIAGLCASGYNDGTYSMTGKGEPLAIYSANGTAAGVLNWASAVYSRE